jgi:L-alanine-DL-glutamate epimerase-like enolase superfamily enzyme
VGANNCCKAYAGGINLAFPLAKLIANIQGYIDAGFNAVKIKVGQNDPKVDIERIRAVRALIGPDITFMINANYGLSVEQAIALGNQVKDQNIFWFEERQTKMPIAD